MNNFSLDITCEGKENFIDIMKLVFSQNSYNDKKVTHYKITKEKSYVFLWQNNTISPIDDFTQYTMVFPQCTELVWGWLNTVDYPEKQNKENKKGWRIYSEGLEHKNGNHYTTIIIQPAWAIFGENKNGNT